MPGGMLPDDLLSVYLWNRGRNGLFIGGFAVGMKESP